MAAGCASDRFMNQIKVVKIPSPIIYRYLFLRLCNLSKMFYTFSTVSHDIYTLNFE